MSKKWACTAAGPFSSTSSQSALPCSMPMWLGTVSSSCFIPCAATSLGEGVVAHRPAQLDVDRGVVDHVVAVGAARHRLEHRRGVEVAHPQARQVRHHRRGGGEAEAGVQLHPVGRQRAGCSGRGAAPGWSGRECRRRAPSVFRRSLGEERAPGRRRNVWLRSPGNNPGRGALHTREFLRSLQWNPRWASNPCTARRTCRRARGLGVRRLPAPPLPGVRRGAGRRTRGDGGGLPSAAVGPAQPLTVPGAEQSFTASLRNVLAVPVGRGRSRRAGRDWRTSPGGWSPAAGLPGVDALRLERARGVRGGDRRPGHRGVARTVGVPGPRPVRPRASPQRGVAPRRSSPSLALYGAALARNPSPDDSPWRWRVGCDCPARTLTRDRLPAPPSLAHLRPSAGTGAPPGPSGATMACSPARSLPPCSALRPGCGRRPRPSGSADEAPALWRVAAGHGGRARHPARPAPRRASSSGRTPRSWRWSSRRGDVGRPGRGRCRGAPARWPPMTGADLERRRSSGPISSSFSIDWERMELRHLDTFATVVAQGTFLAAARALGCSQSTVTLHIQELERDLGVALFTREGRRARLTPAGESLRHLTQRVRDSVVALRRGAEELRDGGAGEVALGAVEPAASLRVSPLLAAFARLRPGVRLRLEVSGTRTPQPGGVGRPARLRGVLGAAARAQALLPAAVHPADGAPPARGSTPWPGRGSSGQGTSPPPRCSSPSTGAPTGRPPKRRSSPAASGWSAAWRSAASGRCGARWQDGLGIGLVPSDRALRVPPGLCLRELSDVDVQLPIGLVTRAGRSTHPGRARPPGALINGLHASP